MEPIPIPPADPPTPTDDTMYYIAETTDINQYVQNPYCVC